MQIIGLTGSIGMGKSFVAREFLRCGVPVFDADKAVHKLMGEGGVAVEKIAHVFPNAVQSGKIDREVLSKEVFGNRKKLAILESILHPLVFEMQKAFMDKAYRMGKRYIVLEIPLLFEKKRDKCCDKVVVVTCSPFLQKRRVLKRQGMTEEKLNNILALQMRDSKKRRKADILIYTGMGTPNTRKSVRNIIKKQGC